MSRERGSPAVPAVHRAVAILDLLAQSPDLPMSAIWGSLHLPKSSVYNLLTALEETGLVEREPETGKYRLGLRILTLAGAILNRLDIRQAALPELRLLTEQTQETTHLGALEGRDLDVIYIEKLDSPQAVKLASYVGRKVPSYCTALGKVLLSGLSDELLRERFGSRPLVARTPRTIADFDQLMAEIKRVRTQGYAIDDEEHELGVRCVAAPVYGLGGRTVAAISVAGPASRLTHERIQEIIPLLKTIASNVSRRMGYSAPAR